MGKVGINEIMSYATVVLKKKNDKAIITFGFPIQTLMAYLMMLVISGPVLYILSDQKWEWEVYFCNFAQVIILTYFRILY